MTTRSTQAVNGAVRQAAERGNPAVEAAHLAVALLDDTETLARPLLQAVGADPLAVRAEAGRLVDALPSASGASVAAPQSSPQPARGAGRRRARGPRPAATSTSRPSTCCSPSPSRAATSPSCCAGTAPPPRRCPARWSRCAARGTSPPPDPEATFQALEKYGNDLTGRGAGRQDRPGHRPRRRDPARRAGARAAAPRTTPCSSASPASARPPSSRAWRSASSPATCRRACAARSSSRSTSAP